MTRSSWLPMPIHSAVLFCVWLLLNDSLAPGHLLLALIFSLVIPKICFPLQSPQPKVHKPIKIVRYFFVLLGDIIVANLTVARLILTSNKKLNPGFIAVPLDLKDDLPITLLASTVSLTPGTVSTDVSEDKCWLYVHALDVKDEAALIQEIKSRYETPLREIFEC